jgi:hypothetical protein
VGDERIFFVGNTMIDTLLANLDRLQKPDFWDELGLKAGEYFVVTLHRPANVDKGDGFARLLRAIAEGTRGCRWCSRCIRARPRRCATSTRCRTASAWSIRSLIWSSTTW